MAANGGAKNDNMDSKSQGSNQVQQAPPQDSPAGGSIEGTQGNGDSNSDTTYLGINNWNRFESKKPDKTSSSEECWGKVNVISKILMCVVLFISVLGTAVVSKLCFVIITANIYPTNGNQFMDYAKTMNGRLKYQTDKTNVLWLWALILMAGTPHIFTAIETFWKVAFRGKGRTPGWRAIIIIFTRISKSGMNDVVKMLLRIIGTFGQMFAIGLWIYHIHNTVNEVMYSPAYIICLNLAPILTSVQWWENFVNHRKTILGLTKEKKSAREERITLSLYASVCRIILLFVLPTSVYGLFCGYKQTACVDSLYFKMDTEYFNTTLGHVAFETTFEFGTTCSRYLPLVVAAVGALSSGICFKLGKIACKIMTQVIDYTLPLVLSTPATFGVILGMYSGSILTDYAGCAIPFPTLSDSQDQNVLSWFMDKKSYLLPFLAGLCGYFSIILVTCHIWKPAEQRIQRTEKLFVLPLYCGIFVDQSLMLNRKRKTKSDKQLNNDSGNVSDAGKTDTPDKPEEPDTPNESNIPDKPKKQDTPNETNTPDKPEEPDTPEKPMVYLCATMWHETEQEMTQLLKSIFRIDNEHKGKKARKATGTRVADPDRYGFEAHIVLDDAFETSNDGKFKPNKYVKRLIKTVKKRLIKAIQKLASEMNGKEPYNINPPNLTAMPYGGQLKWELPGGHLLTAHLKNEKLIRRRKRWSQVMYMYYLLGFKPENVTDDTFLLALDGDVDFKPKAVQKLIDRMIKNDAVGAACGRIHPTGTGVMVWYQIFEYALSHWFQKATEDKFGCVLCSPGCFSLYRASAISEVIKTYTTKPTEPKHYIQYDQGEDRWLCTLLLQQGHRIEYCAAADALTHAPERFEELFNQRKRWIPSTMANILDLLLNWKHMTQNNRYISNSYLFYQSLLMVSSILTPGTTFLMILGAIHLAYPEIELLSALLINAIPVGIFIVLCFVAKPSTQDWSSIMLFATITIILKDGSYDKAFPLTSTVCYIGRIDMIQSQGKRDKKVATLLTEEMVKAIDMLLRFRATCGIKDSNKFIFANQENGHLQSWQVLNMVAIQAGCQKPNLINSVALRKYIATVSQVLDLNQGEVQWLSNHLSHTVKTHSDFYRLQEAAVEIGKVSKLLMLTENGNVAKFQGKSLENIQIDDAVAFGMVDVDDVDDLGNQNLGEDDEMTQAIDSSNEESPEAPLYQRPQRKQGVRAARGVFRSKDGLADMDSDDDLHDPTYSLESLDQSSEEESLDQSSEEESLDQSSEKKLKVRKKRWTQDENNVFKRCFKKSLQHKMMPNTVQLRAAAKQLPQRSMAQIRTRVNNVIKGKQVV